MQPPLPQQQPPIEERTVGCFLAALCGDALGAAVEGWTPDQIRHAFPDGLTEFQPVRMGRGTYTDDSQMLLALAASLVNCAGVVHPTDVATQFATAFQPQRGYGQSAAKVLARLQAQLQRGPLPAATCGSELAAVGGSYGNGGAMRVAPLGLVLRHASTDVLEAAVRASLLPTQHTHQWAVEGALLQALAVAELSKLQAALPAAAAGAVPSASLSGPLQLLRQLQSRLAGRSEVLQQRLVVMEEALQQLPAQPGWPKSGGIGGAAWRAYLSTPAWAFELATSAAVAPGEGGKGFQIKATDAAAAALWAALAHWHAPADAIVAAIHVGGDTDTIACMAGALVGALHGPGWLPEPWLLQLERSPPGAAFFDETAAAPAVVRTTRNMGLDDAARLARCLAALAGEVGG